MNTKDKLKLVERAYDKLYFLNNLTWTHYRDNMFKEAHEEERQHRGSDFSKSHTSDTISAQMAAKMFCVHRVAEYLIGGEPSYPKVEDYLHTQKSCFHAAALVAEHGEEIEGAWKDLDVQALADLDYCEFVKTRA